MVGDFNVVGMVVFISLGLFLFACKKESPNSNNPLIGKWVSPYGLDNYWEFTSEENVTFFAKGSVIPGNVTHNINKPGERYEETVYGPLKYRYSVVKDTVKFETYGSLNNKVYRVQGAMREGNTLYIWNYKTLPGIENHIDEVSYYCLDGAKCASTTNRKVTVIVESGLKGAVHIALGQNDGTPYETDSDGNPVITVDQGTIHKSTLPWHPAYMTHNAFDFVVKDCEDGTLTDLNDWGHDAYRKKANDMYGSDTVNFESPDYLLSAFSLGFNQYARDMLDYEFGEYISGQVASFSIDYLTDQYNYKEYMKKVKSKGEEIKG